jgi:inorganic pyrophosphatase
MPSREDLPGLLQRLYTAHPWHGVSAGAGAPDIVTVFIEMVPMDTVKFEIDKASGLMKLDRPQRYSSLSPAPYGFIPRTWCDREVAALAESATGASDLHGDHDPLDCLVLTERPLHHGGVLVDARPIGGLRMFDAGAVDDKIIAVLDGDPTYALWTKLADAPQVMLDRIRHYFLTYKDMPNEAPHTAQVAGQFDAEAARDIVRAAQRDYRDRFGDLEQKLDVAAQDRRGA